MTLRQSSSPSPNLAPNQSAHILLMQIIERLGLTKRSFLNHLADLGYAFSDDDLANWGRAGRSFPRDWAALHAMIEVLSRPQPSGRRCTAAEALRFLGMVGMPFPKLRTLGALFPVEEFSAAMADYMPLAAPPHDNPDPAGQITPPALRAMRSEIDRDHTHLAGRGLMALTRLMQAPEVRDAVSAFRADFQAARTQITILAAHKVMHDLFQQLEDRYYLIYHDAKRLPADQVVWMSLERNALELQFAIDDLLQRPDEATAAVVWKHKLMHAGRELHTAVEQRSAEPLTHAIVQLKDVLGREPSRVNTRLVSAASALRLSALAQALTIVCNNLVRLELHQEATRQFEAFERGVEILASLDSRLATLITIHNTFQELDDELRRVEAMLDQDGHEITYAWQHLKPLLRRLCHSTIEDWAHKLDTIGGALEDALASQDAGKVLRFFRGCRSQAIRSFNQVDRDLLVLCEGLREVGEPLAAILRMIE